MPVELILIALSPIFLAVIAWEWRRFPERYQWRDSVANLGLALLHQAGDALSLLLLLPLMLWLSQFAIWHIEFSWWALLLVVVGQDFLYYWFHRASHRVRWLWASHVAHHSSRLMNFSTAFRQSLTYPISGMWVFWLPLILAGFEVQLVLSVVAINLAFQFFVHSQSGRYWGWLGKMINSPAVHRVHHARNPQYIDRNYAGVLVIWDKLFGSFVPEQQPCEYGITDDFESTNPLTITFYEWRKMVWLLAQVPGFANKWRVLFGPPELFAEYQQKWQQQGAASLSQKKSQA